MPEPRRSDHEVDIAQAARETAETVRAIHALACHDGTTTLDAEQDEDALDAECRSILSDLGQEPNADGEWDEDGAADALNGWLLEVERWRSDEPHNGRAIDCAVTLGGPTVRFRFEAGDHVLYFFHSWGWPNHDCTVQLTREQREACDWLVDLMVEEK